MGRVDIADPSVQRLRRIALALGGELRKKLVFVGGTILPLLYVDSPFPSIRATKDVDAVAASSSYGFWKGLGDELEAVGFRQSVQGGGHVHQWISSDGDRLDLVPVGDHIGATGSSWDVTVLGDPDQADLGGGIIVRTASAPTFLALKWAAFRDRGAHDPQTSTDLEDILGLIASRKNIVAETDGALDEVRAFVSSQSDWFIHHHDREDLLAGHLNAAARAETVIRLVRERLEQLASIS